MNSITLLISLAMTLMVQAQQPNVSPTARQQALQLATHALQVAQSQIGSTTAPVAPAQITQTCPDGEVMSTKLHCKAIPAVSTPIETTIYINQPVVVQPTMQATTTKVRPAFCTGVNTHVLTPQNSSWLYLCQ